MERLCVLVLGVPPETAERTINSLDALRNWATGRDVTNEQLVEAATDFHHSGRPGHVALSEPLLDWMEQRGITRTQHQLEHATPRIEPPGLDIGL